MKLPLIIIKLGGSVITYKDRSSPQIRTTTIKRLAREIKQILNQNRYQLILVHGAGSFAHPLAKRYDLHHGAKTKEQKFGLSLTQQAMSRLNSLIMASLIKEKIPVISLPPHAFTEQSEGRLWELDYQIIKQYLAQNFVPVLFGDVILDNQWGCSILSGDTIVSCLAQKLGAHKIIFLSDVDGIFDSDPKKNPSARLIQKVNNHNLQQVLKGLSPNNYRDVTGEMYGKIMSIKKNLAGVKVLIINGQKTRVLVAAVNKDQGGTTLQLH